MNNFDKINLFDKLKDLSENTNNFSHSIYFSKKQNLWVVNLLNQPKKIFKSCDLFFALKELVDYVENNRKFISENYYNL